MQEHERITKYAEQKAFHMIEYMVPFHLHEILHKQNWAQKINVNKWSPILMKQKWILTGYGHKETFCGEINILYFDRDLSYSACIWKNSSNINLAFVYFIVCESYIISANKY